MLLLLRKRLILEPSVAGGAPIALQPCSRCPTFRVWFLKRWALPVEGTELTLLSFFFFSSVSHPQKPFTRPNSRSNLNFEHSVFELAPSSAQGIIRHSNRRIRACPRPIPPSGQFGLSCLTLTKFFPLKSASGSS